jgi:hypothetical protein
MTDPRQGSRYERIRDYVLLTIGTFAFLTGVVIAALGNPYGIGVMAAGGTALGLIPTLQRDKGGGRD